MALGRDSDTMASTSMTSSFCFLTRSVLFLRSFPAARAAFLPNRDVVDKADVVDDENDGVGAINVGEVILLVESFTWNAVEADDDVVGVNDNTCWKKRHCRRRNKDFIIIVEFACFFDRLLMLFRWLTG